MWLLLGFADFDDADVPDWISPTAVALGLITAAFTLALAIATLHQWPRVGPRIGLMAVAVCLHLDLAVATAVALRSILGTTILLAGAVAVWIAGTVRSAPAVLERTGHGGQT